MSLVLTRIQNTLAKTRMDKYEYRGSRYGALDCFLEQSNDPTGILTEDIKAKARTSIGTVLQTPVIDYDADITIGNTRTLTIADSENTSRFIDITFATYAWGFTIAPAMYMNNEIGIQRDFDTKMMKYIYKFAEKLDEDALAVLAAKKTKIVKNPLLYANTSGVIEAKWTERENILGDLNVIMGANDFYGQMHLVGDPGLESILKKLAQKDLYNAVNKRNEYNDKVVHLTNHINASDGKYAQGYAINSGTLGVLFRFERDCLLGTVSGDGHEWGIATLPLLNIPCGTYFYDSVGDYSGIAGVATADMTRTRKEHYGFAVDVAFVSAYNSNPDDLASPIIGFNISSENAVYGTPVAIVADDTK